MNTETWTVWVGGVETNDYLVTLDRAREIAEYWLSQGYDDTHISNYDDTQINNIEKGNNDN
jgi:hypothetical protein